MVQGVLGCFFFFDVWKRRTVKNGFQRVCKSKTSADTSTQRKSRSCPHLAKPHLAVNCIWPKNPNWADLGVQAAGATTRELQTRHLSFKHHQNSTRRPPEREERMKFPAGEKKKKREILGPHPSAPHPSGPPTLRAPNPSGPHPSGPPTLRAPTKNKIGQIRFGQIWSTKIGQIRPNMDGQMRPVNFGQMWYWTNSVWPNTAK